MISDKNFIEWKDEYIVGNKNIDLEHIELFKIARKANDIYEKENFEQKEFLGQVVTELYSYVDNHFKNEEQHMLSIKYPLLEEHQELHQKLLEMLNFISLNLPILTISKTEGELYNFVQNIFVKHIIEEDTKLVDFIKKSCK